MPVMSTVIRDLVEQAIEKAGSQGKLAAACGVKQQSIWTAKQAGRVSPKLALRIQAATNGAIKASELCPDFPWPEAGVAA